MNRYIKVLVVAMLLLGTPAAFAQQKKAVGKHIKTTKKAAAPLFNKPSFKGGQVALDAYLSKNLKYPENAKEAGVQGRVAVRFMVDEKGAIIDAQVTRGIGGGCDEEAKRVVIAMPNWQPATYGGKPTRMMYILPISFKLE